MGTMGTMAVLALLLACSVAGESSRMVEETTYDGEYERWTSRPPTPMPEPSEAQELEQLCEVSSMQRAASSRAGSGHAPAANPARDPRCELYLATRHPAHQGGHTSQGGQSHTGQGKEGHQGSQPNPNQGNLPSYKHVQDLLLADRQGRQGWTRHPDTGEDVCERWNPDRRNQQLCAALPCCHFNLNPLDPGFGLCWSDVGAGLCSAPECPVEEPESGSPCGHPAGEQCSYGEECCCGECYPSKRTECVGGRWMGWHTDACFHPNCPTTECPVDPESGSPCAHPVGERCPSGQECCCGECYPSMLMRCDEGRWEVDMFTDACFHPHCHPTEPPPRWPRIAPPQPTCPQTCDLAAWPLCQCLAPATYSYQGKGNCNVGALQTDLQVWCYLDPSLGDPLTICPDARPSESKPGYYWSRFACITDIVD